MCSDFDPFALSSAPPPPPTLSRRTGHYNVHNRSKNAAGETPYGRSNSQDSLDMDLLWKEMESIGEADAGTHEEVQLKVADGTWFRTLTLLNLPIIIVL